MLSAAADKRAGPKGATSEILASTARFSLAPRERVRVRGNHAIATLMTCALLVAASVLAKDEPAETKDKPKIDVCFVLDTTGSMSGLIEGAKQKIWSIANEITSAKPTPDIRVGLIGYRDRGDEYVTKAFDLTNDIDAVYGHLQEFRAAGGGDTPESVNEALHEAVNKMSWSQDRKVLKIIFLVGDAPPHMDYPGAPKYPEVCQEAMKRDLIINTVQCGAIAETTPVWKEIARLSEGSYDAIAQSGGMIAIATPMDSELAELNRKLGATMVAYGDEAARRKVVSKQAASEAAPASVAADRLSFNSRYGRVVQGEGELLEALSQGKVKLESIRKDQLPKEWQALDAPALKAEIEKQQKARFELQARIQKLNKERENYLLQERKRLVANGKSDSFDDKVAQTIRNQAARKGIEYGK
jgi:Mg-chelatase subunit ChlD